jgi:hypothetical protein
MIDRLCVLKIMLCGLALCVSAVCQDTLHPQELRPVRYGKSKQPLRNAPPVALHLAPPRKAEPVRLNPNIVVHLAPLVPDPLVASSTTKVVAMVKHPLPFIEGMGLGMDNFQMQNAPPDANGVVGETQFVQWVNNSIAVFNKNTRKLESPSPLPGNYLWNGFGGNCEENNNGDPIVQYDKLAKRWVLAQFSVKNGRQTGYSECIAISTSADALGDYWLYEFQYPVMDDYPKMGVWPDGYYVSFNMYNEYTGPDGQLTSQFLGSRACVYDRKSMLSGLLGEQQCFQLSSDYFGFMPSDLDGSALPPSGAPNYYVALGAKPDTLDLWKFKVDWKDPRKSSFGQVSNNAPNATIPVAHYNLACNGSGATCVTQPQKVKGQEQLDSLGDRLMFRLAYRHFKDHESLVLNHSVDTGGNDGRTAVRWYELRDLEKDTPTVFQQGTFSPDKTHRWIGSIALDRKGNIALGYNVSGESVYPGIRVAARLSSDPKGAIGNEVPILDGAGIQTCAPAGSSCQCQKPDGTCDTLTRWGDYSAITLDPADDCTFWYTTEYQKTDGAFNWHTGIASFTLDDSCSGQKHSAALKNDASQLAHSK